MTAFDEMLTLTFQYDPADLEGPDEHSLTINYYDGALSLWMPISSEANLGTHTVTGTTDHLGLFGIFGIPEPGTFILLGLGLLGLLALGWRRRQRRK